MDTLRSLQHNSVYRQFERGMKVCIETVKGGWQFKLRRYLSIVGDWLLGSSHLPKRVNQDAQNNVKS